MIVSPEDGWQGTVAPWGSAANNKCQVDQEEDFLHRRKKRISWFRVEGPRCMFRVTLLSVLSLHDQPSLFSQINYGKGL